MIQKQDFLRNNCPAHGESEHDYFVRMAAEYKRLEKAEARQLRKHRWVNQFNKLRGK